MKNKLTFFPKRYIVFIICAAALVICFAIFALAGGFHTHKFDSWEIVKVATCADVGSEARYCSCGEVQTREIPALGHMFGEWETTKEANCQEKGSMQRECACGNIEIQETDIGGHVEVIDVGVAATCLSEGLSDGAHCSVCGTVIRTQEVLPVGDHSVVIDDAVEATCRSTGLTEGKRCSVCETVFVEQETVSRLPHNIVDGACVSCGYSDNPREMLIDYVMNMGHVSGDSAYCVSEMFSSPETPSYLFSIFTDFSGSSLEFEVFAIYEDGTWVTVSIDVTPGTVKKDVKIHILYDDDSTFSGEGYIYPETFNGSSHIYNFRYSDSDLASDAKNMLVRELDFMLKYINLEMLPSYGLGFTLSDIGFYQYK